MKYEIIEANLVNTGGNCMVLFATVWLPTEKRAIYTATSEELSTAYNTKKESLECYFETEISSLWFDDPENSGDAFEEVHRHLFDIYDSYN
jgi:hypothetical protein